MPTECKCQKTIPVHHNEIVVCSKNEMIAHENLQHGQGFLFRGEVWMKTSQYRKSVRLSDGWVADFDVDFMVEPRQLCITTK